ncbi:MAG: AAA-like domain-containing protein [Caldilineales bacterium]|nr:AAA-like domain-containing protein [Caldilineales bacterium]
MFQTEGPLHPSSPLFVGRAAEIQKLLDWVERADCVGAVSGARQTGKTSLLLQLQQRSQNKYGFVFIDLEAIYRADTKLCYSFICREVREQLSTYLHSYHSIEQVCDSSSFLRFITEIANDMSIMRVAIVLDEIGALPNDTSLVLAHTIRSILTSRHVHKEYERFEFILSGSTDMKRFTTDKVSPLRNVIDCVYVSDLSDDEADLVLRRGFDFHQLAVPEGVRRRIVEWTNGHPYLTQLTGKYLVEYYQATGAVPDEHVVQQAVDDILEQEDRNLPHVRRLLDNGAPQLWSYTKRIMAGKPPVRFSRSNDHLADLELCGVIRVFDGHCLIRNRVYERALQTWMGERKQHDDEPQSAIRKLVWHLGRPIRSLSSSQKSVLFVIVITLIVDTLINWTEAPGWLRGRPWLWGTALGLAVLVSIAISLIQARGPKPDPTKTQNQDRDNDPVVEQAEH